MDREEKIQARKNILTDILYAPSYKFTSVAMLIADAVTLEKWLDGSVEENRSGLTSVKSVKNNCVVNFVRGYDELERALSKLNTQYGEVSGVEYYAAGAIPEEYMPQALSDFQRENDGALIVFGK